MRRVKAAVIGALFLALSPSAPAGPADVVLAAHDRCLATVAAQVGDAPSCDLLLMWCDDLPDTEACKADYAAGIAARLADVTAQARAGGMDPARLDDIFAQTVDNAMLRCEAVNSADDCATRNQTLHLGIVVYIATEGGIALRLPEPADVADDRGLPLRDFDRCLDQTEELMRDRPLRMVHPQGPICAVFVAKPCPYMADPAACRDHIRADLAARLDGTGSGAVTIFPHLPPDDLRDLAMRVVDQRLRPLVQDEQPKP